MENKELNENCVMPDYKVMYEEAQRQAEIWNEQYKSVLDELAYLRGIKETVEAFLGRKIGRNGT